MSICNNCGSKIRFRPWYRHHITGAIIYASTYGKRVFRMCNCPRR